MDSRQDDKMQRGNARLPVPETALITGGSRGLGRALAAALAQRGARVVVVAREPGPLDQVIGELRARGHQAFRIAADLGDRDSIARIAAEALALVGPIELLVNNASTLGPVPLRLLMDTDCEDLARALEVNVLGPFRLTKAIAGTMVLRSEGGTVLNITSDAATETYERWGAYGASKAALEHLTRTWAAELVGTGVRVLSVDPGEMDTRMHADAVPEADRSSLADPARVASAVLELLTALPSPSSGARLSVRLAPSLPFEGESLDHAAST